MPLSDEELHAWTRVEVDVDGASRRLGDALSATSERWVVAAVTGRADLEVRLRQAKRRYSWTRLALGDRQLDAALVEDLTRERAVKLGYKLGLPAVVRVGPRGLELAYTGR